MYTQCPECNTAFRITTVQLRMGQGQVVCSKCGSLFDAISSLSDVAFEDHFSEYRRLPTLPMEQALAPPVESETQGAVGTAKASRAQPFRLPRFVSGRKGWSLGIALSFLLLVTQLAVFEGGRLTQDPDLRPWFEDLCGSAGCELPDYRDPGLIEVLEKNLEPIGFDALELRVVMINGSRLDQAFPRIKLELIKLNGEVFAQRVFFPEEYLAKNAPVPARMAAGHPFEIRLAMVKPNIEIGGYQFSLI